MPNDIALTPIHVQTLMQSVTIAMLGIVDASPPVPPTSFQQVRTSWPTQGQPFSKISEDVIYCRAVQVDDDYDKVLDESASVLDDETLQITDTRTRVWQLFWVAYGPNSFDRIRQIRKGLMQDATRDTFAAINMYLIPDLPAPVRAPELFEGQWWERTDFSARFNELVTEYDSAQPVSGVEVIIEVGKNSTTNEVVSDITVEAP
jgi:hypothetical protein